MTSKAVEMPPREWRREDEKGKASLHLFCHVAVFCMYLGPLTHIRLISGGSFLLSGDYQVICRIELPGTGYGTTRRSRVPKYAMSSDGGKENLWGTKRF